MLTLPTTATPASLAIDITRYFFASPEDEVAGRRDLEKALAAIDRFKGHVGADADSLAAVLAANGEAQKIAMRHALYLKLRCARDRGDHEACSGEGDIYATLDARTAFIAGEVAALPATVLQDYLAQNTNLVPFRQVLVLMRPTQPSRLSSDGEALITRLSPQLTGWQWPLYQQVMDGIEFGQMTTADGASLDIGRDRRTILTGPDAGLRKKGWTGYFSALAGAREALAFPLLKTVETGNAIAAVHGFATAADAAYARLQLDPAATRRLIAQVAGDGQLLAQYRARRAAGPAPWDDAAAPAAALTFDLADLSKVLTQALAGLGAPFAQELANLLDPANGRADIADAPIPGRRAGGFSLGFPGTTPVLFVGQFGGSFKDVSVVAHEASHAVHRGLMNANGVLPDYAYGPNYMFEAFAVLSELVLADHLAETAATPEDRRYFEDRFLAIKGLEFLFGAEDAMLEQAIYDGVASGTIVGVEDLARVTAEVDINFGGRAATYPLLRNRWTRLVLAYEDPLYYVNYLYAGLIGLRFFSLYKADPHVFAERYTALLQNGFDAPPAILLQRFLGIDLNDEDALIAAARAVVEPRIAALGI